MRNLPVWLSGADAEVLARFPGDRARYTTLGSMLLVTGAMATVSMWFALHSALGVSALAAIPFALAWGLGIITIDRMLVDAAVRKLHGPDGQPSAAEQPRPAKQPGPGGEYRPANEHHAAEQAGQGGETEEKNGQPALDGLASRRARAAAWRRNLDPDRAADLPVGDQDPDIDH
jgi:hypothetical protein